MACLVVFCTTYALILPVITLEQEYTCGMEEHIHTDSCYAQDGMLQENSPKLICGQIEHQHNEEHTVYVYRSDPRLREMHEVKGKQER